MARLISSSDPTTTSLEECCEALAIWGFDPAEEESLSHAANWLKRLGNDRNFFGDMLVERLTGRDPLGAEGPAMQGAGPNRFVLAPPGRGNFSITADIWPAAEETALRASGPTAFGYGQAHDHNFDFVSLGYFGPGCEVDDYEYDYEAVAGWSGEPVALRPLGRSRLAPGRLVHYRAHHDIHTQHAPASLSVTLTLTHAHAAQGWRDHYLFDLEAGQIIRTLGHGPSETFLRIAVALGGEEARDLARDFGRSHPSDRMRVQAWRALASVAGDDAAQDALWREAEGGGSRFVAATAANYRSELERRADRVED